VNYYDLDKSDAMRLGDWVVPKAWYGKYDEYVKWDGQKWMHRAKDGSVGRCLRDPKDADRFFYFSTKETQMNQESIIDNMLSAIVTSSKDTMKSLYKSILSGIRKLKQYWLGLVGGGIVVFSESVKNKLLALFDMIKAWFPQIAEIVDKIKNGLTFLFDVVDEAKDYIITWFNHIVDFVKDMFRKNKGE